MNNLNRSTRPLSAPLALILEWISDASRTDPVNTTAMNVASVGPDGRPSSRIVLLRRLDENGLYFFTNLNSRKGREIRANPAVALNLYWPNLRRSIRIEGRASVVTDEIADDYWRTRPLDNRISAVTSRQSEVMPSREEFEAAVDELRARHADGSSPDRPAHWAGFVVAPESVEFWSELPARRHERILFTLQGDGTWTSCSLFP